MGFVMDYLQGGQTKSFRSEESANKTVVVVVVVLLDSRC